ncbi:sensor domain-containing protein [Actinoplanes regularis]|uniref:sensor domain-containing protein n=1 Tax=Actinoplanes regularis TaxID=52697 RepID=UPI0024A08ACA|nr:sensor domain-containing protein [Actinoplanes regularis]GLW35912.1 hypothetical protein Areg01_88470 [Actinoplanes regularis]
MTTTQFDADLVPAPAVRFLPRVGADTRYVLTGLPLGLASLVVATTGFAAGAGTAVLWIGVPLMIFAVGMSRGFAETERGRIARVLGEPLARPDYRTSGSTNPLRRLVTALGDRQTWRDLAHATLRFLPSTVAFALTVTWWAAMLGGLTWALWGWALPDDSQELPEMLGLGDAYLTTVVCYLVGAVAFAATLPAVVRWSATFEARFARRLLTGRPR